MPVLVTEVWEAFDFQRGVSARQQFLVTGVSDSEAARAACPIQAGMRFLFDDTLISAMPRVSTPRGPQNFYVDVQFSRNPQQTGGDGNQDDLLNTPPLYKWDLQEITEPVDRDRHGNPITNSVIDPFAQNPPDTFIDVFYTYKRYERVGAGVQAPGPRVIAFSNTVNDQAFTFPGFGTADPGQARLRTIVPATDIDRTMKAALMVYTFAIRKEGWKLRVLDKGRSAFRDGGVSDQLYIKTSDGKVGDAVSEDVLLNGKGIPSRSGNYLVGKLGAAPVEADVLPSVVEKVQIGDAVFLLYERREKMPFGALGLTP